MSTAILPEAGQYVARKPSPVKECGERLPQLDAIRGLAALTVVAGHAFNLLKPRGFRAPDGVRELMQHGLGSKESWLGLFELPPFRLLFAGHEAVILFFLLSGFVLALGFERSVKASYPVFAAKRTCRIYLPYLAALALAVLLNVFVAAGPIPALNTWFNQAWPQPVQVSDVLDHVVMLGSYAHDTFNIAFWSLIHEMRISLVFPALMSATYLGAGRAMAVFAGLSAVGIVLDDVFGSGTDYLVTIHYAGLFGAGALLAKHRRTIASRLARLSWPRQAGVAVVGLGLYCCGIYTRHALRVESLNVRDIPIAAGAALLILLALASPAFIAFLNRPALQWLGRISFSLYLVHASVLFALVHLLYGRMPLAVILLLYIPASFLLAHFAYAWVEVPSMALGRMVSNRLSERPAREEARAR